jgi:hypothetical protein
MSDTIFIIRHGEKPGTPIEAPGIDPVAGLFDDPDSLTAAGWERARALVNLFHPTKGAPTAGLATPTCLFAAAVDDPDSSKRPLQTILPLALSFGPPLPVDSSIQASNITALAAAAQSAAGVVLVAWKHEHIIEIAALLSPDAALPPKWSKDRFDVVFVFERNTAGTYNFSQTLEHALPSDSDATL